jgi:hypothetical protein
MKYVVFWILVTVGMAAPRVYKDEFGRSFTDMMLRLEHKSDTLKLEFNRLDSALFFMDRANRLIPVQPDRPWHHTVGEQYIDSVWMDTVYTAGWFTLTDSIPASYHIRLDK